MFRAVHKGDYSQLGYFLWFEPRADQFDIDACGVKTLGGPDFFVFCFFCDEIAHPSYKKVDTND